MIHKHPERTAWFVIWGAFAIFLLLCFSIPLAIRHYFLFSTTSKPALLEVIGGTVRVHERGAAAPTAVTKIKELTEGTAIETDENSRGIITFFDGSTATIFPATQIQLRDLRVSAFSFGEAPVTIAIEQSRGRMRVGAALLSGAGRERNLQIITPHLVATLAEGSYAIDVSADASQVTVRDGKAIVDAQERSVTLARSQRTVVRSNEPPLPPLSAALDLIVNGDFKDPLARGWTLWRDPLSDPNPANGLIEVLPVGNRQAFHILRSGSNQSSAITGIIQTINKEVSDFRSIRLAADLRVHLQSLSGGGILSSEYPLILRVKYRDVYGSEAEWVHGFYVQNATNNPTNNSELVLQDVWIPFESGNLFETLDPKPFYITQIFIYASGWDYDAYISSVRLIVE
ncbi:MAG: FecR domain-containing protein [Chloroflexi bacterium]|nr:FecR domain-containing protein [Chloroflexota bacterium]MBI3741461.1 FecR domain-containing protein [Chloroflexota bacterium]